MEAASFDTSFLTADAKDPGTIMRNPMSLREAHIRELVFALSRRSRQIFRTGSFLYRLRKVSSA